MTQHDLSPQRATPDVDFGVFIKTTADFEALKSYLINTEGFSFYRENPYVLLWKSGIVVDLLPFGEIEQEQHQLGSAAAMFPPQPGFHEVFLEDLPTINISADEGEPLQFRYCSLAGIILLKLIAWDDRPEQRSTDIQDIAELLRYYFRMRTEHIYNQYVDLLDNPHQGLLYETSISAQIIGREIQLILKENLSLLTRLKSVLAEPDKHLRLTRIASYRLEWPMQDLDIVFAALLQIPYNKNTLDEYPRCFCFLLRDSPSTPAPAQWPRRAP